MNMTQLVAMTEGAKSACCFAVTTCRVVTLGNAKERV